MSASSCLRNASSSNSSAGGALASGLPGPEAAAFSVDGLGLEKSSRTSVCFYRLVSIRENFPPDTYVLEKENNYIPSSSSQSDSSSSVAGAALA